MHNLPAVQPGHLPYTGVKSNISGWALLLPESSSYRDLGDPELPGLNKPKKRFERENTADEF